jgi:hypothetical protein
MGHMMSSQSCHRTVHGLILKCLFAVLNRDALNPMTKRTCVVMFSGGRDSTLAAVRLAQNGDKLILVTVTSGGLTGIERVSRRLKELRPLLSDDTCWVHVRFPEDAERAANEKTCLTCHQAYIVAGAMVADKFDAKHIALGYSGYQASWAEQTPYAICKLNTVLNSNGFELVLPVTNILQKEDAVQELRSNGLNEDPLEQRCVRQIIDPCFVGDELHRAVDAWVNELVKAMSGRQPMSLDIMATQQFSDLED